MTFKEAIARALVQCKFQAGYDACDRNFGDALTEILRPIAEKYHFTSIGIYTGYGRGNKKLSLSLSYNNRETGVYAYIGKVMYFDSKRTKGQSHHNYWDGAYNDYKVSDARTANSEFDDTDVEEFFKNIEATNSEIAKASEVHDHATVVASENAKLISDMTALMRQLMAIEDNDDRQIVLNNVRTNTGLYISCY